jgi:hypothetical protein
MKNMILILITIISFSIGGCSKYSKAMDRLTGCGLDKTIDPLQDSIGNEYIREQQEQDEATN